MIDGVIKYIKQHKKLFLWIKSNKFLMGGIGYFLQLRFVMKRGGWKLTRQFLYHTCRYYIFGIKEDVEIRIKGTKLIMPNHMKALDGAIEVMYDEFYDKLQGYDKVLDLGGYIGESAIRLSQQNKQVVVYEAHPENYSYLVRNCESYKNIVSYNNAVVGTNQKNMTFYGGAFNMGAGKEASGDDKVPSTTIPCVNVLAVLHDGDFDAIKMDIEGSEYECMEAIMQEGGDFFRQLKAGFIEFHFYDDDKKIEQARNMIKWIAGLRYHIECFDAVSNQKIEIEDIGNFEIVFIYFVKK